MTRMNPWYTKHMPDRPFYVSPEMYQRTYTFKTDVWLAGVALYVLVAGYPDDALLQKAFNILQSSKCDRIETLPNLPNH